MQNDNRRFKRWDILEYAFIRRESGEESAPSILVDLSLGGFQIRTKEKFEFGEQCIVVIARESNTPIEVRAEVRFIGEIEESELTAIGLRFLPMDVDQRIALVQYIHDRFLSDLERLAV